MSLDVLLHHGWGGAAQAPVAGDASARRYTRLSRNDQTRILMEDPSGDVTRFARLARHLNAIGLSAPEIYAEDPAKGHLLIEDFGDDTLARISTSPKAEAVYYSAAIDALVAVQAPPAPTGLPRATPEALGGIVDLAFTHYLRAATGEARPELRHEVTQRLITLLAEHAAPGDIMVLRDFHAGNLMWLPDRPVPRRVGLLDFQDAMQGHWAYDLVSLLQDARRDLFPGTGRTVIRRFLDTTGVSESALNAAMVTLGAQRNLRILGVFARLAEQGKPGYLPLLPRVWGHLLTSLNDPLLAGFAPLIRDHLPPPSPDTLDRLQKTCLTSPTP